MQSSAMRNTRIFDIEDEEKMFPHELQMALLEKAKQNGEENLHVKFQYKRGGDSILMHFYDSAQGSNKFHQTLEVQKE